MSDGFVPDKQEDSGFIPDAQDASGFIPDSPPPGTSSAAPPRRGDYEASSGKVSPAEVDAIAKEHGVDPEYLHGWAPLLGVNVGGEGDTPASMVRRGIGMASEAFLGLPNWIAKKIEASPAEEAAIDKLSKLAQERKTGLQTAGELASGFLVPGIGTPAKAGLEALVGASKAAKVAVGAGVTAAEMSAYSLAHASKDEEKVAALHGAEMGGLFGAALGLGGAAFSRGKEAFKRAGERLRTATDAAEKELSGSSIFNYTKEYAMELLASKEYVAAQVPQEIVHEMMGKVKIPASTLAEFGGRAEFQPANLFRATEAVLNERVERDAAEFLNFINGKKRIPKTEKGITTAIRDAAVQGQEYAERQWGLFTRARAAEDAVIQIGRAHV